MSEPLQPSKLADLVLGVAAPGQPFLPLAYYDRDGDCIEFLATGEPFYGEQVNALVTVYRSQETNERIGFLIANVSGLMGLPARP